MILSFPYRAGLSWPLRVVRLGGLVFLVVSVARVAPHLGWSGRALGLTGLIAAVTGGWLLWAFADRLAVRWQVSALLLIGVCGGVLAGLSPAGVAVVFPAVALIDAATWLPVRPAFAITVAVLAATVVGHLGTAWAGVFEQVSILVVCALVGALRGQHLQRVEQSELLRSHVQRAAQEQARAAILAERSRIARELHDVQAHALAALSVQLKVIDALVEEGRDVERVRAAVSRGEQLTREGLVETRRAILVLRDEVLPISDLLASLADAYVDRDGAPAKLAVDAAAVTLPTDATMVLYRAAQEALTNIRKHAEGSPVVLTLHYTAEVVTLTVVNELVARESELSGIGAGHGLAGLAERAGTIGGTVRAGAGDGRWELRVELPL